MKVGLSAILVAGILAIITTTSAPEAADVPLTASEEQATVVAQDLDTPHPVNPEILKSIEDDVVLEFCTKYPDDTLCHPEQ